MACLFFHNWVGIEHQSSHFWHKNKTAKWYEYSIGKAVCTKCGKQKDNHRFQLFYLPSNGTHVEL